MSARARGVFILAVAAVVVTVAAIAFLTAKPEVREKPEAEPPPAYSAGDAAPAAAQGTKPASRRSVEPPRDENLPKVFNLSSPEKCLIVNGGVYDGVAAPAIARGRIPALYIYNACKEPRVFSDVKTSPVHVSYAYSRLPLKVVLREPHDPANRDKDKLILVDRGGEKCDELETPADVCRFAAVPVRHVLIIPMAERLHFAVQLKDRRRIEGYFNSPHGQPPRKGPPLKGIKGK